MLMADMVSFHSQTKRQKFQAITKLDVSRRQKDNS